MKTISALTRRTAVLAVALLTAPAAVNAADCLPAGMAAQITQQLEMPAEALRERLWHDAERSFAAATAPAARQRHDAIAGAVAARSRQFSTEAMTRLAAVPGTRVVEGSAVARRAPAADAGAPAAPVVVASAAGCR